MWDLLNGGSVTVRRMRAFAVANEMGRVGSRGSCFRQFVSGLVAADVVIAVAASAPRAYWRVTH